MSLRVDLRGVNWLKTSGRYLWIELTMIIDQCFNVSHDLGIAIMTALGHGGQLSSAFILGYCRLRMEDERHSE